MDRPSRCAAIVPWTTVRGKLDLILNRQIVGRETGDLGSRAVRLGHWVMIPKKR